MILVGFRNFIDSGKVVAVAGRDGNRNISVPVRRRIDWAKDAGKCMDMTSARPIKSVIFLNDGVIVLSHSTSETIAKRINEVRHKKDMLHIGHKNYIDAAKMITMSGRHDAKALPLPLIKQIHKAQDNGRDIDLTAGEMTRTVIYMDDGQMVLSAREVETLTKNIREAKNNE